MRWIICGAISEKFTFVKSLYFCSRYGMLTLQIADQYMYFGFLSKALDPWACTRIFIYKTIIAQVAMTLIEMVLLVRVYALYNQNFRARNFLAAVFFISTSLELSAIGIVVHRLLAAPACVPPEGNGIPERLYGVGAGVCQSVVFIATVYKLLPVRQRRTPLTSLLFKESVFSIILVFILVAIIVIYEITRNIYTRAGTGNKAIIVGSVIYSWYLALLSIIGSRLILNMRSVYVMHRLRRPSLPGNNAYATEETNSVYLTTVNE
ncbi:hypothetical protein CPB84DRAFT_324635 [Gymnopilus junonius]|uniref:Uncharacterized protein n=1 Tax=Gymnopilus junonius TaxID=109634 RepID=A0A9P5NDP5_GYMJU|nr:hypothetical protein CPB84DRAFT_324635 [Gymnopilus junonius]